jgi:hypothetical protein
MSRILRVFGTLTFGMLAANFIPANAAQLVLNTGAPHLCAVVQGGNTAPGTPVIAYSCKGGPEDQWNYINGQLQGIGTANGKSMCLDVKGSGIAPGTLVDLWPCNEGLNQQWTIFGGAIYTSEAEAQGELCLDSNGGPAVGGGTQLVINPCNFNASQDWTVRGIQLELNASAPHVCATVSGSHTADGTPVIAYSCNDEPGQILNLENDQLQGIGTENTVSKCLTASGISPGSLVTLSTCTSTLLEQQAWIVDNCSLGGPYCIVLADAFLCLDSSGGPSVGGGTQLVANTCTGGASQNWAIR